MHNMQFFCLVRLHELTSDSRTPATTLDILSLFDLLTEQ